MSEPTQREKIASRRDELVAAACEVRQHAYAPYSNYKVGAAILTASGTVYTGVNVENASYGATVCAERVAFFKAVTEGDLPVVAVAVCTENGGSPCGPCRQVMSEFVPAEDDAAVWIADATGNVRQTSVYALLPDYFGPGHLL